MDGIHEKYNPNDTGVEETFHYAFHGTLTAANKVGDKIVFKWGATKNKVFTTIGTAPNTYNVGCQATITVVAPPAPPVAPEPVKEESSGAMTIVLITITLAAIGGAAFYFMTMAPM